MIRKLFLLGLVGVFLEGCSSCSGRQPSVEDASAASVVSEPPVPMPDGVIAEVQVTSPASLWRRVQEGVGGPLSLLPKDLGAVTCAITGLDGSVEALVDGAAPAYAVIAARGETPAYAIAVHLKDPGTVLERLVGSETARYEMQEVEGLRRLVPKGGGTLPMAVGVSRGGYLVAASDDDAFAQLGPFAARTLPTRPRSESAVHVEIPGAALSGRLRADLASAWAAARGMLLEKDEEARALHGGRAADFGDAASIVASLDAFVERRLAFVGDLASARLDVDKRADGVRVTAVLEPRGGSGPARTSVDAMRPGDTAPLLQTPADALLSVLVRDGVDARAEDARELAASVEAGLGARLPEADARRLRATMDAWARGRGDWLTVSVLPEAKGARGFGVVVRTPSASGDALPRATRDALELAARPAFAGPLSKVLPSARATRATQEIPGGRAEVVRWAGRADAGPLEAAWADQGGTFGLALGEAAVALLAPPGTPRRLGEEPSVEPLIAALESNATLVVVAHPFRLDAARGGGKGRGGASENVSSASVVAAWGRQGGNAWARVDISDVVLRELTTLATSP